MTKIYADFLNGIFKVVLQPLAMEMGLLSTLDLN